MEVLDLVDQLHEEMGRTVVMVLHDLNLAVRYSDHLIVMRDAPSSLLVSPRTSFPRNFCSRCSVSKLRSSTIPSRIGR